MKRIINIIVFAVFASGTFAQGLTDVKICIDPGHGGHESDDRHILATDFWESEGNLTKALELDTLLSDLGANVLLTRYANDDNVLDDPSLSQRVAIANAFDADFFHSIHSNGFLGTSNYTVIIYREVNGSPVEPDAVVMCDIMREEIHDAHRTTAAYTRGDYSFVGYNLGVLNGLDMVGTLSEGSFHDYIPESWRLQNLDYRKHESWAIARSFRDYFSAGSYGVGEIAGVVRNNEQYVDYFYITSTNDAKAPVNGMTITVTPGDLVYHGDDLNNGFFLFDSLNPGQYKVVFEATNFDKDSTTVTVTANRTVFADRYLSPDSNWVAPPPTPEQIRVYSINESSLRIECAVAARADSYVVFISQDGLTYPDSVVSAQNSILLTDLTDNQYYNFKLKAKNGSGSSALTQKVYGGAPSSAALKILLVNGFDRSTNTRNDYVRFYGRPIAENGHGFSYCLNEEVYSGRMSLQEYDAVIWVLGDESTVDDTFNPVEQDSVEAFLSSGGYLFVSGAEIGWDLDYKGTTADKNFYHNFLKASYTDDAPNNQSSTYYSAVPVTGQIFDTISQINFDDGTKGTIDVLWPDAIAPYGGSVSVLKYKNATQYNAGIGFEGMFPGGSKEGKLLNLGFPFESIYYTDARIAVMAVVLDFFNGTISDIEPENPLPQTLVLGQNYPNPFNPATQIAFTLPAAGKTQLVVYNLLGQQVRVMVDKILPGGSYDLQFNAQNLASGTYIYELRYNKQVIRKRMLHIK